MRPVMKVMTRIIALKRHPKGTPISYDRTFVTKRDSLIAVLPVGYADGYMRVFSSRGWMAVKGRRAPVAGRVCMDLTMLDVTGIESVSEGDEVTILGDGISHCELAGWAGTNAYEIMTSLGGGSRRTYLG
jgi:alanine racemase